MKKILTALLVLLLLYIVIPFLFKTGNAVLNGALVLATAAFLAFWCSLVFGRGQDHDAD
ncbi:hypothetical protein [Eubacterium sp. 1001713B170207_170306_E7]|uniref:hypothetical protein n=1 Tax=Eubacterium sp. 1001713B170207_170306_E7 TaxID=2787097 RepID=UPI0018970A05|nr:hypothetical protein [Eubacterium sp. 1001713B170207_170306_E7]